jgi:hypothetical protein
MGGVIPILVGQRAGRGAEFVSADGFAAARRDQRHGGISLFGYDESITYNSLIFRLELNLW